MWLPGNARAASSPRLVQRRLVAWRAQRKMRGSVYGMRTKERPVSPAARSSVETPPDARARGALVERLLDHASREIRLLSTFTPRDAHRERAKLIDDLRAGRRATPRWTYAPRPHEELRRALDSAVETLERSDRTPVEALYLARAQELSLEAAMCARVGTADVTHLARARFEPLDEDSAGAASALCSTWLCEPRPTPSEGHIASDDPDPKSLLSQMRAAVGRLHLPFKVVATPWLAALAATGDRVILVTTNRLVSDEDTERTVLHEIEGHARPRARAMAASSALFRIGTARGIDDQEGRAVWLEERAGMLGPGRRRQLAARHRAVEAMLGGASFADVAAALVGEHGLDVADAVIISERAFRGGDGTHPGLGRERVYLESLVRVRQRLGSRPEDEAVLAAGQVSVDAIDALRRFAPDPCPVI